jgi:hypothetical protein
VRTISLDRITSGERSSGSGGPPPCSFSWPEEGFERERVLADNSAVPMPARFFYLTCDEQRYLRWFVPGQGDPVADGLLVEWVQEAFDRIDATMPALALSPSADRAHLTGMPSWLAVDPAAFVRIEGSVSAGEVTITAFLEPQRVEWQMGDGSELISCPGAGNTYSPDDEPECSHTYVSTPYDHFRDANATTYPISARVVYEAGYTVTGPIAPGTYSLQEIPGPETAHDLLVQQVQAVRVAP